MPRVPRRLTPDPGLTDTRRETLPTNTASRMTVSVASDLAMELDQARARITKDLKTRISMNAVCARYIRLGLEAEAAHASTAAPTAP